MRRLYFLPSYPIPSLRSHLSRLPLQAVVIPQARKDAQKGVDTAIISKLDKITTTYLASKFTLSKGQYPHQLKF